MPTIGELIGDVRSELNGELGAVWNVLDGAVSDTDTTFVFEDALNRMVGGRTLVTPSGEEVFVRSVNTGTKTATVIRAFNGSTAAAVADGALIEVGPRFGPRRIRRAIHASLRSLPTSLFRVVHSELEVGAGGRAVLLDVEDVYFVLQVRRAADSSIETRDNFPIVTGVDFNRAGPSGYAGASISLARDTIPGMGSSALYVALAVPFLTTDLDDSTDLVDDVGLSLSMVDIPLWGACAQVLSFAEASRLDIQAANQKANQENVPATALAQVGATYERMRDRRIRDEADRLRTLWPMMVG